jgi:hypothetical protein
MEQNRTKRRIRRGGRPRSDREASTLSVKVEDIAKIQLTAISKYLGKNKGITLEKVINKFYEEIKNNESIDNQELR